MADQHFQFPIIEAVFRQTPLPRCELAFLNLGDNVSQNPALFAYPIANIADKA